MKKNSPPADTAPPPPTKSDAANNFVLSDGPRTINVEEFEPDVFRQIVEYVHIGTVTLQPRTLLGVMNAADVYGLEELKSECLGFLEYCINVDTVCSLLSAAEKYLHQEETKPFVQKVLSFVEENGDQILTLPSFAVLPRHVVNLILGRPKLQADELTKFKAVLQWSARYCHRVFGTGSSHGFNFLSVGGSSPRERASSSGSQLGVARPSRSGSSVSAQLGRLQHPRCSLGTATALALEGDDKYKDALRQVVAPFLDLIALHLVPAADIMEHVYSSGVVDTHRIIVSLAYQADPRSVDLSSVKGRQPRQSGGGGRSIPGQMSPASSDNTLNSLESGSIVLPAVTVSSVE